MQLGGTPHHAEHAHQTGRSTDVKYIEVGKKFMLQTSRHW